MGPGRGHASREITGSHKIERGNKIQIGKTTTAITLSLLIISAVSGFYFWKHGGKPPLVISRSVILEPGLVPHPNAIARTQDDGFLIVGEIPAAQQAWATRTDSEGNVRWRYVLSPHDAPPYQAFYPNFSDAVAMPNGDSFLCGQMPVLPRNTQALISHLNAEGKLIEERLFEPKQKEYFGAGIEHCFRFRGGFVSIGTRLKHDSGKNYPNTPTHFYYWIVFWNNDGKFIFEQYITSDNKNISNIDIIDVKENYFTISSSGPIDSEVVKILPDASVSNRFSVEKSFRGVNSIHEDGFIRLISQTTHPLTLITLDNELKEISRISEDHEGATIRRAFRLGQGDILAFGDEDNHYDHYPPQAVFIDKKISEFSKIPLGQPNEVNCCDGGSSTSYSPNTFVNVRGSMQRTSSGLFKSEIERVGAVLDFVQINHP